jgi:hypothetical protein
MSGKNIPVKNVATNSLLPRAAKAGLSAVANQWKPNNKEVMTNGPTGKKI